MEHIMKKLYVSLSLLLSPFLCAEQDPWKGEEYAKNSASQQLAAEGLLQGIPLRGTENILDVGCGDGKITAAMAQNVPQGSAIGVDISPSMIQMAQNTFAQTKNLSFQIEDAAKIAFQSQFDLITCFTVMQWVLDQQTALKCFEKALKPGGKVCIVMPTGLPPAMQQALEKTISSARWSHYYTNFAAPWRFYQPDEYRGLLQAARLTPTRLEISIKRDLFPSRAQFHAFLKQWFPHLRVLAPEQKDDFLTDLLDHYLSLTPLDEQGRVPFIVDQLNVEAVKP